MDVLKLIQRMEITPELTRSVESIKNITGFEQQDLSVWNTNDTSFEVEINEETTYTDVAKCFLITDGTNWYFVIVSCLECGAFDYTLIETSDITSIGGDIKDILQTSLAIDVPLSLVYSDDFNITGTLLDENEDAVSGAIVKLFVGSTVVDSKTTDSNGDVSFTQTPVHMGTHSFHLEFAGINNYLNSESSTVTRDIDKETSVLNIASPLPNTSVYNDGSLIVNGTLLTNDAEAIADATVLVKQNDTTITSYTTGSNGSFNGSISASNLSTGNLVFVYETTSTYTASTQTIAITVATPSLSLTSDKSILSYADEEYATLTATLLQSDNVGKTVSFDIVDGNGDFVETIGTDTTDSDGVASCRYDSAGVGDLNIVAKYSTLLSETYTIEDCYFYDVSSQSGLSHFGSPYEINGSGMNQASITYDSTEQAYKLISTGIGIKPLPILCLTGKDQFKMTFDVKPTPTTDSYQIGIECIGTNHSASGFVFWHEPDTKYLTQNTFLNNNWDNQDDTIYNWTPNIWYTIELTVNGTNISIVIKNSSSTINSYTFDLLDKSSTLFSTLADRQYGLTIGWKANATLYGYAKNIKVKTL